MKQEKVRKSMLEKEEKGPSERKKEKKVKYKQE
jgi:hypothetical protein